MRRRPSSWPNGSGRPARPRSASWSGILGSRVLLPRSVRAPAVIFHPCALPRTPAVMSVGGAARSGRRDPVPVQQPAQRADESVRPGIHTDGARRFGHSRITATAHHMGWLTQRVGRHRKNSAQTFRFMKAGIYFSRPNVASRYMVPSTPFRRQNSRHGKSRLSGAMGSDPESK